MHVSDAGMRVSQCMYRSAPSSGMGLREFEEWLVSETILTRDREVVLIVLLRTGVDFVLC